MFCPRHQPPGPADRDREVARCPRALNESHRALGTTSHRPISTDAGTSQRGITAHTLCLGPRTLF
eukprot:133404-Prymnesium_polylepis.1